MNASLQLGVKFGADLNDPTKKQRREALWKAIRDRRKQENEEHKETAALAPREQRRGTFGGLQGADAEPLLQPWSRCLHLHKPSSPVPLLNASESTVAAVVFHVCCAPWARRISATAAWPGVDAHISAVEP
eukprot:TRINITY_DN4836_c0_g2_i1.p2 TRINITY_DN4836_c0_g2~~TRINITY_DN4836_c0_g2_i1.p2  ORF type:complete len:131 (-),score=18.33 TRINITY_DN4836_c0_g2_i1:153-545(-)